MGKRILEMETMGIIYICSRRPLVVFVVVFEVVLRLCSWVCSTTETEQSDHMIYSGKPINSSILQKKYVRDSFQAH